MTPAEQRSYHHGDLRETLMANALAHIAAEGTEKLSLRALAREAGVSATAPYRHFPTKRCLLAALATRGFRQLTEHIRKTVGAEMSLEERLIAMGVGYVEFALANPTAYQLMFGSVLGDFSDYGELVTASEDAYQQVLDVLDEVIESRPGWDMDALRLGGIVWSAVHGIASVLLFGMSKTERVSEFNVGKSMKSLATDVETAVRVLMRGVLAD